jgi:putative transcriptional regulator
VYRATVLVVTPVGGDMHVGFIINRPTTLTLGTVIPEHAPAQKLSETLFLGGPVETDFLFSLVEGGSSPGGKSFEIMPGIYAAYEAIVIDRIIKSESERARFFAGLVAWRPRELRAEIEAGAWYVIEPDAGLVMSTPEGLWEKLVRRLQGVRT